MRLRALIAIVTLLVGGNSSLAAATAPAGEPEYPLVFPIAGEHSYCDTYGAPRSGGRTHKGTDIFAEKMTPVVAAADGRIVKIAIGKTAGRYIVVEHDDGWLSLYLHLNNDTPGTDDGLLDELIDGIAVGAVVQAGDHLDYVGDSGNAEGTPPHLHFELHRPDNSAINPYPALRAAQDPESTTFVTAPQAQAQAPAVSYEAVNTTFLGKFDPGGGFTADVVVHDDMAFLGTWGRPGICPGTGIRMVDVADRANPELVGSFAGGDQFPGTAAETLWIGDVATPSFDGTLAIVALRLCDNSESGRWRADARGLALYDLTDPDEPSLLSTLDSGELTQGANSVAVSQRPDGMLLVAATVRQSLIHTAGVSGDVRFIDATDPAAPIELSDWDYRRDGPLAGRFAEDDEMHAHSVALIEDGTTAVISHWDAGTIVVDLTDPSTPTYRSTVGSPDHPANNHHSVVIDETRSLVIVNQEDLGPALGSVTGWGAQQIYEVSDQLAYVAESEFATHHALNDDGFGVDGFYSAHHTTLVGPLAVTSWYSDGIRIIDLSDPAQPVEIGSFVPSNFTDPQGYWVAPNGATAFPLVWGVDWYRGLIFLSDINSGLWIVRIGGGAADADETGPVPG